MASSRNYATQNAEKANRWFGGHNPEAKPWLASRLHVFAGLIAAVAGVFLLCLQGLAGVLVNGKLYGDDVSWTVTLEAGTVGSLFGDTMGPVQTFDYETVVLVDDEEKLVVPGGTYSSNMPSATYTAKIPLKQLGILEPEACGRHHLVAYTRNFQNGQDIHYTILVEDIYVTISKPLPPDLEDLTLEGILPEQGCVSTSSKQRFLVAGRTATATAKVVDFDPECYTFVSAELIGIPYGGVSSREHRYSNGRMVDNNRIVFSMPLSAGRGFHGKYKWKVKAVFASKVDKSTAAPESHPIVDEPVFFEKYGKDNKRTGNPNWFTYWGEDGACPGLRKCQQENAVEYDPAHRSTYGAWSNPRKGGDNKVHLSRRRTYALYDANNVNMMSVTYEVGSAGFHYPLQIVATNKKHGSLSFAFGGLSVYGIKTVEEVIAHELTHKKTITFYNDYQDKHEFFLWRMEDDDADPQRPPINGHAICDYLFNVQENDFSDLARFKLDTHDTDSYGLKAKAAEYEAYGDNEFIAMVSGSAATANGSAKPENDWAFPGEQSCLPDLSIYATSTVSPMTAASYSFSMTNSSEDDAAININSIKQELERDENQKVSSVHFKIGTHCVNGRNMYLQGEIKASDGSVVATASERVVAGDGIVDLAFNGRDIYESMKPGPYELSHVGITEFDGSDMYERSSVPDLRDTKIDLRREDFARGDAYVLEASAETVAADGIVLPVNVEINAAGEYEITATLAGAGGAPVASASVTTNCVKGTGRVNVVFPAKEILGSGVDGPYTVDNIAVVKDGVRVDSRLDFCVLRKKYRAAAFDIDGSSAFDAASFLTQFDDYTPPAEVQPPERFWVFFNPNGGTVTETSREVVEGDAVGALPVPTLEGDEFLGWYTEPADGTRITASTVITGSVMYHARWKNHQAEPVTSDPATPDPVTPDPVTPDPVTPDPDDPETEKPCYEFLSATDIVAPYDVPKAVTLRGAVFDGCEAIGIVELKLGKVNARKGTGKIAGSVTGINGTKFQIRSVTLSGIDGESPAYISLEVKNLGTLLLALDGTQFTGYLEDLHVQSVKVGGVWTASTATVKVDADDLSMFSDDVLEGLLPEEEQASVAGGRWKFAGAAGIKWAKPKRGAALPEIYDEATGKGLIVDESRGKTNLSGLKLTYTPKKGSFKGSFKVYELQGAGRTRKLKKYTITVNGIVVEGLGYGTAYSKRPYLAWPVGVE